MIFFLSFLSGVLTLFTPCFSPLFAYMFALGSFRQTFGRTVAFFFGLFLSFWIFAILFSQIIPKDFGVLFSGTLMVFLSIYIIIFGSYRMPFFSKLLPIVQWFNFFPKILITFFYGLFGGILFSSCSPFFLFGLSLFLSTPSIYASGVLLAYFFGILVTLGILGYIWSNKILTRFQSFSSRPFFLRIIASFFLFFGILSLLSTTSLLNSLPSLETYILKKFPQFSPEVQLSCYQSGACIDNSIASDAILLTPENFPFGEEPLSWLNYPRKFSFSDIRSKEFLLVFWSDTCSHCEQFLSDIQRLSEKFPENGLLILGLHAGKASSEKALSETLSSRNILFPVAIDANLKYWKGLGGLYWPTAYLVGSDGKILNTFIGISSIDNLHDVFSNRLPKKDQQITSSGSNISFGFLNQSSYTGSVFQQLNSLGAFLYPENIPLGKYSLQGGWYIRENSIIAAKNAKIRIHTNGSSFSLRTQKNRSGMVGILTNNTPISQENTPLKLFYGGRISLPDDGVTEIIRLTNPADDIQIDLDVETGIEISEFLSK